MNETLNALSALVGQLLAQRWHRQQEQNPARVRKAHCGPGGQSAAVTPPQPTGSDTELPAVGNDSIEAGP